MADDIYNIRDLMSVEVITVYPETPLQEAAKLLIAKQFAGVPVVDRDRRLIGILTEYDLLMKDTAIHVPTLQIVFGSLSLFDARNSSLPDAIDKMLRLTVQDAMNPEPLTLPDDAPLGLVVETFRAHHRVNPIPVIDRERHVVGIVSRSDIVRLFDRLPVSLPPPTSGTHSL